MAYLHVIGMTCMPTYFDYFLRPDLDFRPLGAAGGGTDKLPDCKSSEVAIVRWASMKIIKSRTCTTASASVHDQQTPLSLQARSAYCAPIACLLQHCLHGSMRNGVLE